MAYKSLWSHFVSCKALFLPLLCWNDKLVMVSTTFFWRKTLVSYIYTKRLFRIFPNTSSSIFKALLRSWEQYQTCQIFDVYLSELLALSATNNILSGPLTINIVLPALAKHMIHIRSPEFYSLKKWPHLINNHLHHIIKELSKNGKVAKVWEKAFTVTKA